MKKNKINKQQIQRFPTRTDKGLTNYQANLREAQGYSNATEIKVSRTYLDIFIKNFITFFNILFSFNLSSFSFSFPFSILSFTISSSQY